MCRSISVCSNWVQNNYSKRPKRNSPDKISRNVYFPICRFIRNFFCCSIISKSSQLKSNVVCYTFRSIFLDQVLIVQLHNKSLNYLYEVSG